mgnify:CR=1 FL=1
MNKAKLLVVIFSLLWMTCIDSIAAGETKTSVLGPGDVLKIFVYGHPDLTTETKPSLISIIQ